MPDINMPYDDSLEGKEDCEKDMDFFKACEKIVHQKAKVTLPISIEPFVVSGKIRTRCCGTPKVSIDPFSECKNNCDYVITQEVCIDIPLKFGVATEIKESFVECEKPSIEDHCND
jgi:hypothetical protein